MRSRWLRYALLFSCHVVVHSDIVNITVDDTDPSIMYIPQTAWRDSSTACPSSSCLVVDTNGAHNKTYHTGTHVLTDQDDLPSPSSTAGAPAGTAPPDVEQGDKQKGKGSSGSRLSKRLDPDDPGFVDTPVTAQFKFNGTAIYLFGIQPHGPPPSPLAPTNMNLSFTLDNNPLPPYLHSGVADGTTGFTTNFNVLAIEDLPLAPHVLLVNLGINSTFLFDYMIYTTQVNGTSTTSGIGLSQTAAAETETAGSKKHNVATFAGAVAGSLGVVTVFAIGLCFSIYWRRRKSALRERRDRETQQGDGRTMVGPQPFIPRYFPGTVPPPYTPVFPNEDDDDSVTRPSTELPGYSPPPRPARRSASVPLGAPPNNTNSGTGTNNVAPPTTLTYADLPLVDDDAPLVPPPSFPDAIASPAPTILTVAPPPMTLTPPHSATSLSPTRRSLTSSSALSDSHSSSLDQNKEPPLSEPRGATNSSSIAVPVPLHLSDSPVTPGSRPATSHSRSSSISRPLSSLVMTSPPESEIGGSLWPTARW